MDILKLIFMVNTSLSSVFFKEEIEDSLLSDVTFCGPVTGFVIFELLVFLDHFLCDLNEECWAVPHSAVKNKIPNAQTNFLYCVLTLLFDIV